MIIPVLKASEKFLPDIFEINNAVQGNPWSLANLRLELEIPNGLSWVTTDAAGKATGYLFARSVGESAELLVIGVRSDYMRQNIGKTLVTALLKTCTEISCKTVFLEVSVRNTGAIEFYRHLGFQIYMTRPQYYRDGTDALCMKLELAKP